MLRFQLMGKIHAIQTTENLKEHVNGAGLLCLTLRPGDFISIGASVFIGFSKVSGSQIRLNLVTPKDQAIQRYEFVLEGPKLPLEGD